MPRRSRMHDNPWAGTAFLVEALLLLLALLATLAVFVSLLSRAITTSNDQATLDRAVVVASNAAEDFCSSPTATPFASQEDGFEVSLDVTPTSYGNGTLYQAVITVSAEGEVVYTLETARYVGGGA